MTQGKVYVFSGDGKGKTSAALGISLRAVGHGMKVGWISWYKQASWHMSEVPALEKLGVNVFLMGAGFHISHPDKEITNSQGLLIKTARVGKDGLVVDTASGDEHVRAARLAFEKAVELVTKVDVLVLDEINNALADNLIETPLLEEFIHKRGKTHLILTGRSVSKAVVELADLVSNVEKVKHPYDHGELAVRGLDF